MDPFLMRFFPSVYAKEQEVVDTNQYCKFDSVLLTLFTSSLYLAALVASLFASVITRKLGCRATMLGGGLVFLVGAVLNGFAVNIAMLIIGRILLGIGVGFSNQAVPLYLSEMAPAKMRGMLNISFQLMITVGILAANLINYFTAKIAGGWGWRISLGLAAVPALIMAGGSLPPRHAKLARRTRQGGGARHAPPHPWHPRHRLEYDDLVAASEASKAIGNPWKTPSSAGTARSSPWPSSSPRCSSSPASTSSCSTPRALQDHRLRGTASLMSSVISGGVNMLATFVSIATVDRLGRRKLLLKAAAR
ncbi:hypothetical protein ZWY2020_010332 [Hordeum vulgare]|nr:hypothetical protein ZWY2020_010332 [Hordeum vulgare]